MAAGTVHVTQSANEIAATVAVEDLMNRILADDPARIPTWDGHEESVGSLVDADGTPLAGGVLRVGRRATVDRTEQRLENGPRIVGWTVRVEAIDREGHTLGTIERWTPASSETDT